MVSTWISPRAVKGRPSEIAGRGLVAVETIERDEVVAVKGGHLVTGEQLRAMPEGLQSTEPELPPSDLMNMGDDVAHNPLAPPA